MAWDTKGILAMAAIALLVLVGFNYLTAGKAPGQQSVGGDGQCFVIPTYSYSAVDKYTAATVVGTDQIKENSNAPVSSLQYPTKGDTLAYWKSNASWYCDVKTGEVACASNNLQTKCVQNATSVSINIINKAGVGSTVDATNANNLTMGANSIVNLQLQYTGTSKKAFMPLGGCVAAEYPSTLTAISMSGSGISSSTPCPYAWTYSVASTSNTYRVFAVPAGFDDEAMANQKNIDVQLQSGSTNPSGTVYFTFQSANTYVTNAGDFTLGIEKDKNDDTTKVGYTKVASFIME